MKGTDIRTVDALITEYGMSQGSSTPTSQQQSGASAKISAASKPQKSPTTMPSQSPTTQQNKMDTSAPAEPEAPVVNKARELDQDLEYQDDDGDTVKVISPHGQGKNKNSVIVQNQKSKEFYTIDPNDDIELPAIEEKIDLDKITKRKKKLHKKIKRLLRAQKHLQQGEIVTEINFNSKNLAQEALQASIRCGFEAETVWEGMSEVDEDDDMSDKTWSEIEDLINDQEGHRGVESVEEGFREWIQETDYFYDAEREVIDDLISDRKDDEEFANRYVDNSVSMDDVDEYKEMIMSDLAIDADSEEAQEEIEERNSWDEAAWAREYVEVNEADAFEEWLIDDVRDNGEAWDQAWDNVLNQHDPGTWCDEEYRGSWRELLGNMDIWLYADDGGGMDAVATQLEDWASNNSFSNDVRAGGYHSGKSVDNNYWRVEDDSSIEANGGLGAELISPVYDTPADMLNEMKSLFEFMQERDIVTNSSTGMHVTMSMKDKGAEKVNALKIALLLGDKYVLKQFGRENNTYTDSQQAKIQSYVENLTANFKDQKSLEGLEEILTGAIGAGKFSSINFKTSGGDPVTNDEGNQLIEFRVAGGDDYHTDDTKLIKTVIRYAAVMQAGHNKDAYRADYIKALFRVLNSVGEVDPDTEKNATSYIDPETVDTKTVDAFKAIASKQSYKDVLEYLGMAYSARAKANKLSSANPQQELQFEDANEDRQLSQELQEKAKQYFTKAMSLLIADIATGRNRTEPKVQQIAGIRAAVKDFGIPVPELYQATLKSRQFEVIPGGQHDREEAFATALNNLLKVKTATARQAEFTITFDRDKDTLWMPTAYRDYLSNEGNLNIFGSDTPGTKPPKLSAELFKNVPKTNHDTVRGAISHYSDIADDVRRETDLIQRMAADPDVDLVPLNARKEKVAGWQKEMEKHLQIIDQFNKTYQFVPTAHLRDLKAIFGDKKYNLYSRVNNEIIDYITKKYNIRFTAKATESKNMFEKFEKLSLKDQLAFVSKFDTKQINEAHTISRKKMLKEGAVPNNSADRKVKQLLNVPLLANDLKAQMEAYFVMPIPSMIKAFREARSYAGDNFDLRPIFKSFLDNNAHPELKKKAGITESTLLEYTDLSVERDSIIKIISQLDVTDEQQAQLLDKIYKIINSEHISTTIGTAFSKPLDKEPMGDTEKLQIKADMAVVIAGLNSNFAAINQFLDQLLKTGSIVNLKELSKPMNTLSACLNGSDVGLQALQALSTYGVGKKQKGPGEYALAILSDKIHLATGEGDLEIEGIGKVELKAANSSAGGRIGYGGGSQKMKRDAIAPFAEYIPTIMAHTDSKGGSMGLRPFIDALNTDLPITDMQNQAVRKKIMTALLVMDMESYAGPIINKIATSDNISEIESIYLQQNFLWYKNRDAFDALLLIHIPNQKTSMIKNEQDLAAWHRSGHAQTLSVSIIPTQAGAGREQWAQLTINKAKVG